MEYHEVIEAIRNGREYKGINITIKRKSDEKDTFWVEWSVGKDNLKGQECSTEEVYDLLYELQKPHRPIRKRRW